MLEAIVALVSTAILIGAIYGVVFWANRARTDRSASVGIYLLFGLPGGLLTVAGAALILRTDLGEGPLALIAGISCLLPLIKPFRRLVSLFTPLDPSSPIDLSGLVFVIGIPAFLTFAALNSDPTDVSASILSLILNLTTFVAIAYVAVGYRIYRSGAEATQRLGLTIPSLKTVAVSVAMVIPCFVVSIIGSALTVAFQPDVVDNLEDTMDQMTSGLANPIGALLIGLSAGIGEEVLFRGAIQARFGIIIAALFWTTLHIQYDFSFVLVGLFGVGILLGLQRKYLGTTSAVITHALYNMVVVGIQIGAS